MKARQQTEQEDQAEAQMLADVGLAALADPLRVEKNDEQDAGDSEDQSDEFRDRAASPLGIVEFIGAIACLLDRRTNLVEVHRAWIERDRDRLGGVVGLDAPYAWKLPHGSFDDVLAATTVHAMGVESNAETHSSLHRLAVREIFVAVRSKPNLTMRGQRKS